MRRVNVTDKPPRGETPPRASRATTGARSSERGGSSSGAPAPTPLRGQERKLHESLTRFYTTIGMGIAGVATMRGDIGGVVVGTNIGSQAEATADAWIELAQQNPRVAAMLNGFIQGSAMANIVACHASMVIPVLAIRGVVPTEFASMFLSDDAKQAGQHMAEAAAAAERAENANGNSAYA